MKAIDLTYVHGAIESGPIELGATACIVVHTTSVELVATAWVLEGCAFRRHPKGFRLGAWERIGKVIALALPP
jgi:hypothetical protein